MGALRRTSVRATLGLASARPNLRRNVSRMANARLRIVHVVRAPIGGIFRHIVDLATAQSAAGHAVGIVCNSLEGGAFEDGVIARLAPQLAFGVTRFPMRRAVSPSDLRAARDLMRHLAALAPDVVHCHGSKGGIY